MQLQTIQRRRQFRVQHFKINLSHQILLRRAHPLAQDKRSYFSSWFEPLRVTQRLPRRSTSAISKPSSGSVPTNLLSLGDGSAFCHPDAHLQRACWWRSRGPSGPAACLAPAPWHSTLTPGGEYGSALFSPLSRNPTFSSKLQTSC